MSVMLSAASCLDWLNSGRNVPTLIAAAQLASRASPIDAVLPYLSGERTLHNNPQANFLWLRRRGPAELARAVLEGVGYALADGADVVHACGVKPPA